jgi:hypothetical protein
MKFNPIKNELFAENGQLIKKLGCPFTIVWDKLELNNENSFAKKCSQCSHSIIDTAFYTEKDLLKIFEENPKTCLKININQENLTIEI